MTDIPIDTGALLGQRVLHMTPEQLHDCGVGIVAAMNQAQFMKGFSAEQVMMTVAYFLGGAVAQCHATLLPDAPLRAAFPPIVQGYEAQRKHMGAH